MLTLEELMTKDLDNY